MASPLLRVRRARLRDVIQALSHTVLSGSCLVGCSSYFDDDSGDERDDLEPEVDDPIPMRRDAGSLDAGRVLLDAGPRRDARGSDATPEERWERFANDASLMAPDGPYDDGGIGTEWTPLTCENRETLVPRGMTPTRKLDYLAVYYAYSDAEAGNGAFPLLREGNACRDAVSVEDCRRELRDVFAEGPCLLQCVHHTTVIAGTDGTFERITERADLLALLGSIDTVAEAVALAMFDERALPCNDPVEGDTEGLQVRRDGDALVLVGAVDTCGNDGVVKQTLTVLPDGRIHSRQEPLDLRTACTVGRRPAGLCAAPPGAAKSLLGLYLAQSARLEAASVYAFRQLAHELSALAAPGPLVDRALAAVADELRHTRRVASIARAHGTEPTVPEVEPTRHRPLREIALDNAVEGCVRETFGALLATHQAQHAQDPEVRAAMQQIAEDETRHAQLSWDLAAWLAPQLTADERAEVAAAQTRGWQQLAGELDVGLAPEERAAIGYPSTSDAARLLAGLQRAVLHS